LRRISPHGEPESYYLSFEVLILDYLWEQTEDSEDDVINPMAPYPMNLPKKKRLELLANLIVDKIREDQRNGSPPLKKIRGEQKSSEPPEAT
jgi:hypothetical protein